MRTCRICGLYAALHSCAFVIYIVYARHLNAAKTISRNVDKLISSTDRIVSGNLTERVRIDSEDEFAKMAHAFDAMMTILDLSQEQTLQISRDSRERFVQMIEAFVRAIEAKDIYTRGHSENVAYYVRKICEAFDWPEEDVENMRIAALLHDIGKIGLKEAVLNKSTKLTNDEYSHMQEHPVISRSILGSFQSLDSIANVAIHHHERYDWSGYPNGLEGEEIPFGARMLAVADAFDAMTSRRPHKVPMSIEDAIAELERHSGTQFDPMLVMVFVELLRDGKVLVHDIEQAS